MLVSSLNCIKKTQIRYNIDSYRLTAYVTSFIQYMYGVSSVFQLLVFAQVWQALLNFSVGVGVHRPAGLSRRLSLAQRRISRLSPLARITQTTRNPYFEKLFYF